LKNNRLYFFICIFLIAVSCNQNDKIKLLKTKEKLIHKIPCDTNLYGKLSSFVKPHNSSNLFFLNKEQGDVYILEGDAFKFTRILESKIYECETFSIDEKNNGVVLFTLDSFYVFRQRKLLIRRKIPEFKKGVLFYDDFSFKPLLDGDNLHLMYYHKVFDAHKNKDFYDKNFECIFNIRTNKIKVLNVTYPKSFREYCVGHHYLPERYPLNESKNLYFFRRSDSIKVFDKTQDVSKVVFCGSREKKNYKTIKFSELSKYNNSIFDELDYENPHYLLSGVLSKNDIVYRMYIKSFNDYQKSKKKKLILYDCDLRYIGETDYKKQNLIFFETENRIMSIKFQKGYIACYEFSYQ
jgi:hypothetical protein